MNKPQHLLYLLQKGCEYMDTYHNLQEALEYFKGAREAAEGIYGKDSKICSIVNLVDYIDEEHRGDYRSAVLKLADAGQLLDNFGEQDVIDEFTEWIYSNKDEMLNEGIASTWNMFVHLGPLPSVENIIIQALLSRNDMEELMNRILIDPLGLPRRFHYLIRQLCRDSTKIGPDAKYKAGELLSFMQEMKNTDLEKLSQTEKINFAKKIMGFANQNSGLFEKFGLGEGMSRFFKNVKDRMGFDFVRGMAGFGETEFAEWFLSDIKEQDIDNIDAQIKVMLLDCFVEFQKGSREAAGEILDHVIELENEVITQVFFLRDEQKKMDFLNGLAYIMKRVVNMVYVVRGAREAYSVVLRTRTLSFDRSVIRLDSDIHKRNVIRMKQLEAMEKEGEDVSLEKAKLVEYLEKASGGIFTLDSMEICRKLKDTQAVLEFTVMTDVMDQDYYYVFVVTVRDVIAVPLGACSEIDPCVDGVMQFIQDYMVTKHSAMQIKMLKKYYELYKKILCPIGEVLPRKIQSLFIAAAGELLQIPFGMLPGFYWYDGFMEDEYHIFYITSGKEILRTPKVGRNHGAVVVGNPDFQGKFSQLPFSDKEVKVVADILKVNPITGKEAVPACLKRPASIFHISTHSIDGQKGCHGDRKDPMDQIGLVFAGGELLTIREIGQLDLSGTNLVMLSACGVSEEGGVYSDIGPGIRRAFINANARHIILNLWKTDDHAATLLMKCFYDNYIHKGVGVEESLRHAKYFIRTSTAGSIKQTPYYDSDIDSVATFMEDDEVPYAHPYYWAGFIIVGI